MAFDKKKYWREKKDNIASKRPKPVYKQSGDAQIMFIGGKMIVMNRAARRHPYPLNNLHTRKGYIERLNAILIKRLKHGKVTKKYVLLDKVEV